MVSLPEAAASLETAGAPLDPLTASLVDGDTIFVLNKVDAVPDTMARSKVVIAIAQQTGLTPDLVEVSILRELGLQSISDTLKHRLEAT